jgi:deoxyribose-phosphate aldolase
MAEVTYSDIAKMFDHSMLQPGLTDAEMEAGCRMAREYGVATVCIKPYAVKLAGAILAASGVDVCTTIGFPHGGHLTSVKVYESERAMDDGAKELDTVVNIGKVLGGDWDFVANDIAGVVEAAHTRNAIVKVIFENCFLKDEHKIRLCKICGDVGADFVKTSTGYGETGATDHDLALMRKHSPPQVQVKAAGGVKTFERVLAVRKLGVTRIGASVTKAILDECKRVLGIDQ